MLGHAISVSRGAPQVKAFLLHHFATAVVATAAAALGELSCDCPLGSPPRQKALNDFLAVQTPPPFPTVRLQPVTLSLSSRSPFH